MRLKYSCKPHDGERRPTSLLVLSAALIFLVPFDNLATLSSFSLARNPAAVIGLMLSVAFVVKRLKFFRLGRGPTFWGFVYLLSTFVTQLLLSGTNREIEIVYYAQWVQPVILFLIMTDLCKDPRSLAYICLAFFGALSTMALTSFMGLEGLTVVNIGQIGDRMGFSAVNLNRQAYWYALGLTVLVWIVLERKPRLRKVEMLVAAGAVLLALALLRTGSRGGLLAATTGIFVLLSLSLRKRNLSALASLIPLLVLAGFWLASTNEIVVARFGALMAGTDDGSRMSIWLPALDLVAEKPWLGVGPGFADVLGDERGMGRNISSHNSYLQVTLAFGIPVFLIWVAFLTSIMVRCWRYRDTPIGALLFAMVAASLVNGISSDLGFNKYFWVLLAVASQVHIYAPWLYPGALGWNRRPWVSSQRRLDRSQSSLT